MLEALGNAHQAVAQERALRLKPLGLTAAQADLIAALDVPDPLSLTALSERLGPATPPSRLVSFLREHGLVERVEGEDRRRVDISLTKEGKAILPKIRKADASLERWVARKLGGNPTISATRALKALGRDQ